jgi:histone H3/H4
MAASGSEEQITFNEKTIEGLLKNSFQQDKTKISADALKMTSEVFRVHSIELLSRCAEQAKKEGADVVTTEHFEKILPQFLLDFS